MVLAKCGLNLCFLGIQPRFSLWSAPCPQIKVQSSLHHLSAQQRVKVSFLDSRVTFEKNGGIIMEASINTHKIGKLLGCTPCHQHSTTGIRRAAAVERAIKHSFQLDKSTIPPAICVPCVPGKHRDPFPSSEHTATRPMKIIYCDLCGPFNVRTCQHKIY
jgi:hypothetical protein